jgi:hypothetical protein
LNPGSHGGKPATNHLRYGAAQKGIGNTRRKDFYRTTKSTKFEPGIKRQYEEEKELDRDRREKDCGNEETIGDFVSSLGSCKEVRTLSGKTRNYSMEVMQVSEVGNYTFVKYIRIWSV